MLENDFTEVDYAFESVFEAAMEATEKKLISTKDRNQLPDECFGIIYTNDKGKVVRAYPLKVPGNKKKTAELIQKSLDMFHYCLPKNKPILAKKILEVLNSENVKVTISERNQIFKYIDKSDLPDCVIIKPAKKKGE